MNLKPDVLIIGAGPAGSIAAALMARQGFSVTVVEKSRFPRFAIGESLLPQCMEFIEEAGMLEAIHARGYQRKEGGLFRYCDEIAEFDFSQQFTQGWSYTYQVPRDDFDHVLAKEASTQGAEFNFGIGVNAVVFHGTHVDVEVEGEEKEVQQVRSKFILDASGAARVLARHLGLSRDTGLLLRSSLFSHVTGDVGDPKVAKDKILISVHPENRDVWYWTIPFADGKTSVGIVAEPEVFDVAGEAGDETYRRLIAEEPNVAARLKEYELLYPARSLGGYSHSVTQLYGDRFAILGNAGEFLDPVFSSGVTVAMKSASLACKALTRELHGEEVNWEEGFSVELRRGVDVFGTYVRAWYDQSFQNVIFSAYKDPTCVDKICSILAGYVWDQSNPLVAKHQRGLQSIVDLCELYSSSPS